MSATLLVGGDETKREQNNWRQEAEITNMLVISQAYYKIGLYYMIVNIQLQGNLYNMNAYKIEVYIPTYEARRSLSEIDIYFL